MIKKTLSHGVKVLKLSTWISASVALLIVLVTVFFVTFPSLIKAPIERQISEFSNLNITLSKISFNFEREGLTLKVHDLKISSPQKNIPIAAVDRLQWDIDLLSLLDDIYRPSDVYLDTLTLYYNTEQSGREFGVEEVRQLVSRENLQILGFFKSLKINKTLIKDKQTYELAPISLVRDQTQLSLKISDQNLDFSLPNIKLGKADIIATFSTIQSDRDIFLTVPLMISNDDLSLNGHLKFFNDAGDNVVEFVSHIEQMQTNDLAKYLPSHLLGDNTSAWIKRAFISGELKDAQFQIKKNLSKVTPVVTRFSAQLKDTELLFNSNWNSLKHLDATIETDGQKIVVIVNSTQLNGMELNDIKVQILDMSQPKIEVEVIGKINTRSERIIQLLQRAPLSNTVKEVLHQFTLAGKVTGNMKLVFPLDKRKPVLDIDLYIQDNHLTTLDGAVTIENYYSEFAFHDGLITSVGVGDISGIPFEIRINPNNLSDDYLSPFRVELINNANNFEIYIRKMLNQSWRVRVESENVKGNAEITLNDSGRPSVELQGLQVTTIDALKGEWNVNPSDIPSMYLSSKGIYVDEYQLPDLTVELTSEQDLLLISHLQFEGKEFLSFNGSWYPSGKTSIRASAKGQQLSEFLEQLNIKEKVKGGEFNFDIRLFCDCAPWNINLNDITGVVGMNVKEGVFTDKDPNIGRILSLLNIKSIAKRLKRDVGDITEKGFAYDDIQANLTIGQSLAKIEHFKLNATSGVIELTGQSNIVDQEYDMRAKVIPAVGDAVPAATALAGGGLIGLGIWIADEALFEGKLIDSIMGEILEFEYKITGPWDDPIIE